MPRSQYHRRSSQLTRWLISVGLSVMLLGLNPGCSGSGFSQGSQGSSEGSQGSSEGSQASGESSQTSGDSSKGSGESSNGSSDGSSSGGGGGGGGGGSASSLAATLVVLGVGSIVLLGYAISTTLDDQAKGTARRYLEKNRRMVRVALARGEGAIVGELAATLELPPSELDHLGSVLHSNYVLLEPYLEEAALSDDDARDFSTTLITVLESDPRLAPRVHDLRARIEHELTQP